MYRVNKEQYVRFKETMASSFFEDAIKDSFKYSRFPKTAHIILTQRGEMRDGLTEVISNKPTVRGIGFNFLHGLAHGANPEKALHKRYLKKNNSGYPFH
ncbi:hypothetical protein PMJ10TS2_42000 [Paenibacillus melissococcoides]